jgi:hypothetical protein
VANGCITATAEFEPLGEDRRATVNGPVRGDPQGFALGPLRRGAECGEIRELPRHQPGIGHLRPVQPAGQPVRAGGAEGAVSVIDDPRHVTSHPGSDLSLWPRFAETYVHVACPRSA